MEKKNNAICSFGLNTKMKGNKLLQWKRLPTETHEIMLSQVG